MPCSVNAANISCTKNVLEDEIIYDRINEIFSTRNSVFISKDLKLLREFYDSSQKYGKWSLDHEVRRVKYLNDWSKSRGITFTSITSEIFLRKAYKTGKGVRAIVLESYKFDYKYDDEDIINTFGVGINHTINFINKNDSLIIYNDWYTDCFEDALKAYSGNINDIESKEIQKINLTKYIPVHEVINTSRYKRADAVKYADKYCGGAFGNGNNYKYNSKYRNFNGIGGDCTNFASQVLGDKEGGNMRFDGTWFCRYKKYGDSEGTMAWVNADSFRNYLLYSGKGKIIKKGTFKELVESTMEFPNGAVEKIIPGDLICYIKKNDTDHFAIVTAKDSHGYPLVNSHTTDRYHVPWDLGWGDNNIRFNLISVR